MCNRKQVFYSKIQDWLISNLPKFYAGGLQSRKPKNTFFLFKCELSEVLKAVF